LEDLLLKTNDYDGSTCLTSHALILILLLLLVRAEANYPIDRIIIPKPRFLTESTASAPV